MREVELEAFADQVCRAEGVPTPKIKWRWTPWARVYRTNILMPSTAFIERHNGGPDPERHQMLLMHELAHWIARHIPRRVSRKKRWINHVHGPYMYATLFRLAEKWGIDMEALRAEEQDYMPGPSAAGWRLYQEQRGNTVE